MLFFLSNTDFVSLAIVLFIIIGFAVQAIVFVKAVRGFFTDAD